MQQSDRAPGLVCTFYSYKGGVGRSMALANVAALLARYGRKVLVIDWDLEAPGLEKFFGKHLLGSRVSTPGLLDLIGSHADGQMFDWRKCLLTAAVPQGERIALLHAGRDEPEYLDRLHALDWDRLFRDKNLGRVLDGLREEWISEYDFVLIDSRTGITDIGGICSILMPEYLVCLFTTNEQSLKGIRDTMARARKAHAELPLDRRRLIVIPIPARDESNTEYNLARDWRATFARELGDFYSDWIPKGETAERVLDYLKIPHVAYWSFGERLPVLEEETDNPKKLAFSYAVIARLIDSRLDWDEVKQGHQAAEAQAAQRAEAEKRAAEAARIREEAQRLRLESERKDAEAAEQRVQQLSGKVEGRYFELVARQRIKATRWRFFLSVLPIIAVVPLSLLVAIFVSDRFADFVIEWLGITRFRVQPLAGPKMILAVSAAVLLSAAAWSWRNLRATSASVQELEREYTAFTVRAGIYDSPAGMAALQAFASRIEEVIAGSTATKLTRPGEEGAASAPGSALPLPTPTEGGPPGSSRSVRPGPPGSTPTLPPPPGMPPPGSMPPPSRTVAPGDRPAPFGDASPDVISGPIDVILSYARSSLTQAWLREFRPLFESWLAEYLGRAPVVVALGEGPPGFDDRTDAMLETSRSRGVGVVIVSRAYAKSEPGTNEFRWLYSQLGPSRIFPIVLDRDVEATPELREIQWTDLSDFAFVGEGFSKSERYVDFQAKVRELARRVADVIEKAERAFSAKA